MSTPSYHADMKCGAYGGPLEDDRSAVCHRCTALEPEAKARLNAWLESPCPRQPPCPHPMGDHGLGPQLVCCQDCPCGWEGATP
jgi:hypothetical protein